MGELLQSPLHDRHVALGAKLADFGGWEMPIEYPGGGVLKEHAAVRSAVGIFDVSHLGKARVRGPGAADLVDSALTNDLSRIGPGQAQYTLCCDPETGGVVDDLIAYLYSASEVFLIPNAANTAEVVRRLAAASPPEVAVENLHTAFGVIAVQGPAAPELVSALGLPVDGAYMSFTSAGWKGAGPDSAGGGGGDGTHGEIVVCRSGYTGERGFELVTRWADTPAVWDALLAAGASVGARPCGLGARDTLRTEMGYPLHGQDLSPSITPVQARAGWAVGWNKPRFWGRDALLAERSAGPARLLWGLRSTDRGIPRPHMAVYDLAGGRVGEVTSGTFSPTLRTGIGLALLDRGVAEGDTVRVDVRGRPSAMTVLRPPFVDSSPK
ncbi:MULTISPECIES: glycine cleavage system aminomethyltransferase GcvT [Protofrankia]|uniref:aminomethyltransferase n=1 Tax=Protofrankia coriariae TaxID=1562887 RepID=A0ABR5F0K9_9ACTN|nr:MULTISPECIES: glycine cleavage system aminomethyltransferase GcvT [Protofrankia]KLL10237.1 glycine cleavage system protein T [Protofrankia coriariae]ONH37179.1 glycine cleavage system protein T [Protofrankia sp. BMG5.30]